MKKLISIFLTALMVFSVISTGVASLVAFAEPPVTYKVGDHIQYGYYPQSLVTDSITIRKLNNTNTYWWSYQYYIEGIWYNFMEYRDVVLDGEKYRAVRFSQYRPDNTYGSSSDSNFRQYENGYQKLDHVYWFKYEPISWRILDPDEGLIVSELILDSRDFEPVKNEWIKDRKTVYPSNYALSRIREWLNKEFYYLVFTQSQKENIKTTNLENKASNDSKYDSSETNDKVFFLSYWDMINPSYGFDSKDSNSDESRSAKGTDYAKAQGLWVYRSENGSSYDGNSFWYLRTPCDACAVNVVDHDCTVSHCRNYDTDTGIRPACKLNVLKDDLDMDLCFHKSYESDYYNEVDPTCYREGREVYFTYCEECGDELSSEVTVLPKLPHTDEDDDRICDICGATVYKVGDLIQFGNYPQSLVEDKETIKKLEEIHTKRYEVKNYAGNCSPGSAAPIPNMYYRDAVLDGERYRCVYFYDYKTNWNCYTQASCYSWQDENKFYPGKRYWFKYEPITWRVLDPYKGLVVSETILDSQAFNNMMYLYNNEKWGDKGHTYYAMDYSKSDIRHWLNADFYDVAFNDEQKNIIVTSSHENWSPRDLMYDSPNTDDNVFLLSYWEVLRPAYGFSSESSVKDRARYSIGSDYSKCQGLWVCGVDEASSPSTHDYDGYSGWMLRNPGFDGSECYVEYDGTVGIALGVDRTDYGIRPACTLSSLESNTAPNLYIKPCEHKWDDGVVTRKPTCRLTGIKTYTCGVCETTKTETIPRTEHTYKETVTPATTSKDGSVKANCIVCGSRKSVTVIPMASNVTLSRTVFTYTGKIQRPTVYVKDKNGKTISTKYYKLEWSNKSSKAPGGYKVKVKFEGYYIGEKTLNYSILPRQVGGVDTNGISDKAINLKWKNLTEAKAYRIEQSTDGKNWKTVKTVTTNSAKITNLKAGTKYQFRVTALDSTKKVVGKSSTVLKTQTRTTAPTITVKSTKSKTVSISWKKVTGAKSYIVYKSTDGKKWSKVTETTKTTVTISKQSAGKKLYFKVIAVNAYGDKSVASTVRTTKVKK